VTTRTESGKKKRQKIRLRPDIGEFDGKNLANLARQVKALKDGLLAALNGDSEALAALGIVNGNATPPRLLPQRPELEFVGDGVELSLTKQRYVATISGGVTAVTAVDGVDASAGTTPVIRTSRDVITISTSGAFNDWAPSGSWRTADILIFTPTGFTVVNGFDAPSGASDSLERICWNASSSTSFDISHNSSSNSSDSSRVLCPDNIDYTVRPRAGWRMLWDTAAQRWRIQGPSRNHATLTNNTSGDPHTQYILVAGTRAFTGDQSMGNNNLTNINQAVMTGSSSLLVMSGGSIVQVDDITANGSGSVWNLNSGNMTHASFVELQGNNPSAPSAGEVRISAFVSSSVSPAAINAKAVAGELILHPELVAYEKGSAAGGSNGIIAVDFSSINGRSLSDGVFQVIVKLTARNTTASRTYPQINLVQWIHYEMDVGGTNVYSQVMDQMATETPTGAAAIAYWDGGNVDSSTSYIQHSTTGGSTLNVEWAALPGGTDTWKWWVSVQIVGAV
jgi:hypothetical protein